MYFVLALFIGILIGALACLPKPHTDFRTALLSLALGLVGSAGGWQASVALGVDEVGPLAQLFVSAVASGAVVSVYHAVTSERAGLR